MSRGLVGGLLIVLGAGGLPGVAQTTEPDVVVVRVGDEVPPRTANRRGTIVEWKGSSLQIELAGGLREIENGEIVEIRTRWPEPYQQAQTLIASGQTDAAINSLAAAIEAENRPWAQRIIAAQRVAQLMLIDRPSEAARQFLEILKTDPQTRFLPRAPLSWTGSTKTIAEVENWLGEELELAQLIGASWAWQGPLKSRAQSLLDELVNDLDPRLRGLAIGQTWRGRIDPNPRQLKVWSRIVAEMPDSVRAGPRFLLADRQARAGQTEAAVINWMKIVTINEDQPALVAASLYRVARLLEQQQDSDTAQALFAELKTRFPESVWARQQVNGIR